MLVEYWGIGTKTANVRTENQEEEEEKEGTNIVDCVRWVRWMVDSRHQSWTETKSLRK